MLELIRDHVFALWVLAVYRQMGRSGPFSGLS
jgi:hypothetical protein